VVPATYGWDWFEIHEALDRLYTQGYRATRVIIARRYQELISGYLERSTPWRGSRSTVPACMALPVDFRPQRRTLLGSTFDLKKSQVCLCATPISVYLSSVRGINASRLDSYLPIFIAIDRVLRTTGI